MEGLKKELLTNMSSITWQSNRIKLKLFGVCFSY